MDYNEKLDELFKEEEETFNKGKGFDLSHLTYTPIHHELPELTDDEKKKNEEESARRRKLRDDEEGVVPFGSITK